MAKKTDIEKAQTKGIVIMAFGKVGYAYAAWNLAKSIKTLSPSVEVCLIAQETILNYIADKTVFDTIKYINNEEVVTNSKLDPAKAKINLYKFTPFDHTLYIDADCILLKDIEPLFDECIKSDKYYLTTVIDKGGKASEIRYSAWATNEKIWQHFKLKDDAILPAIQSSWCYVRKCKEADKFHAALLKNFDFPIKDLSLKWGGGLPDELIYSGTCAQLGLMPEGNDAVFFGNTREQLTFEEITNKHYILTLYGSGSGRKTVRLKYIEWYDRLVKKYAGRLIYKSLYILRDKHVDSK